MGNVSFGRLRSARPRVSKLVSGRWAVLLGSLGLRLWALGARSACLALVCVWCGGGGVP